MKKYAVLILAVALISSLCFISFAHRGNTDFQGGHYDRSTGKYHYHHGYPAHSHYDMDGDGTVDCPYNFDDKTNQDSNNNSDDKITDDSDDGVIIYTPPKKLSFGDIVLIVLKIIGNSICLSLSSVYLTYMIFGFIKIIVEAVFKISIKESISRRIWNVILIIDIVVSVVFPIFLILKKQGIL